MFDRRAPPDPTAADSTAAPPVAGVGTSYDTDRVKLPDQGDPLPPRVGAVVDTMSLLEYPLPLLILPRTADDDVHTDASVRVPPTRPATVECRIKLSPCRWFEPITVTDHAPVDGPLTRTAELPTAMSVDTARVSDPSRAVATDTTSDSSIICMPVPLLLPPATDDADLPRMLESAVHTVACAAEPRSRSEPQVADATEAPRPLVPMTVTDMLEVAATLEEETTVLM